MVHNCIFCLQAEAEVLRLQQMKSSKIKEVLFKKRLQLEEICRGAHMVVEDHNSIDFSIETIESGNILGVCFTYSEVQNRF